MATRKSIVLPFCSASTSASSASNFALRLGLEIGGEIFLQARHRERYFLGIGIDEEIERVDDGKFRQQIDLNREMIDLSGNTMRACQLPCGSCCQLRKWLEEGFSASNWAPPCGCAAPGVAGPPAALS